MGSPRPRRAAGPDLPEIEWIDAGAPTSGPPAGLRSTPTVTVLAGALAKAPPRVAPVRAPRPPGNDHLAVGLLEPSVHRRLRRPVTEVVEALEALHTDLLSRRGCRRGRLACWQRRGSWLAFDEPDAHLTPEGCRVPGSLRTVPTARPAAVELVVEPWSPAWTEVRLQLAGTRRTWRLPRRWFDAAHPLVASLRDTLAASG